MAYFNERWNHMLDLAAECEEIVKRNGVVLLDKNEGEIGTDFSKACIERIEETTEMLKLSAVLVRALEKLMHDKNESAYFARLTEGIEQLVCGNADQKK